MSTNGYLDPEKVASYIKLCEGLSYPFLYERLQQHLPQGSSLLELGTGPGNDLAFLAEQYKAMGSDLSPGFVDHAREKLPQCDVLQLDAVAIDVPDPAQRFDCIYSNKVLHLLSMAQLEDSCRRQRELLREGGLFAHTFWMGDGTVQEIGGMSHFYHERGSLLALIEGYFVVIDTLAYEEFSPEDSLFVIARRR